MTNTTQDKKKKSKLFILFISPDKPKDSKTSFQSSKLVTVNTHYLGKILEFLKNSTV